MAPIAPPPDDPAPDHAALVANAMLAQAASPTARLAQRLGRQRNRRSGNAMVALAGLFCAQERGTAAAMLDGSFHPRLARRPSGGR